MIEYTPNRLAKPWLRGINRNFFHPRARYAWRSPFSFQLAGHFYISHVRRRHRDAVSRVWNKAEDDRYLNPDDARAKILVVQSTNPVYDGALNSSWRRTYVTNTSSLIVRVARWPFQRVPDSPEDWVQQDWITVGLWWLPTCCVLLLLVCCALQAVLTVLSTKTNGSYTSLKTQVVKPGMAVAMITFPTDSGVIPE